MFKIVEIDGKFVIKIVTRQRFFWVFVKEVTEDYKYNKRSVCDHPSYHHALQVLLIDIEYGLNIDYLNSK